MKKDPGVYLEHILHAVERIFTFLEHETYKTLTENVMMQDAVIRQLAVIGEAASRVPMDVKSQMDIPWRKVIAMRNFLIHEYYDIDLKAVWRAARKDLPKLKKVVAATLKKIDSGT